MAIYCDPNLRASRWFLGGLGLVIVCSLLWIVVASVARKHTDDGDLQDYRPLKMPATSPATIVTGQPISVLSQTDRAAATTQAVAARIAEASRAKDAELDAKFAAFHAEVLFGIEQADEILCYQDSLRSEISDLEWSLQYADRDRLAAERRVNSQLDFIHILADDSAYFDRVVQLATQLASQRQTDPARWLLEAYIPTAQKAQVVLQGTLQDYGKACADRDAIFKALDAKAERLEQAEAELEAATHPLLGKLPPPTGPAPL